MNEERKQETKFSARLEQALLCHFPMRRLEWLRPVLIGTCALPLAGTLLSFSRGTHWLFRMWDFPRVQMAVLAAGGALGYSALFFRKRRALDVALVAGSGAVVAYQLYRIHKYTPLVRPTVKRARRGDPGDRIVLMMTNVLMDNDRYDLLLETIERENPDVILAVEVDDRWNAALEPLLERYPYAVRRPQDNFYGIVLLSRLELVDPKVDFLVQEDIPSIHTGVRLRSGTVITLHGLHPRPPEPVRDQPSSPRDAELVIVGRAIGEVKAQEPVIVAGDLNDVAWSPTSELFVRLSGLLDPRTGRGFFNSYNANNPLFRYPLDHVFHSVHFELVRLARLPWIGSDHFPILIELQYDEHAPEEQEASHRKKGDESFADEKLEQESHDAATGFDRPRGE